MPGAPDRRGRLRLRALGFLALVTPLSLFLKYYNGPAAWWLNNWGSSFGYEIFFVLLVFLILPEPRLAVRIALAVCLSTVALEFVQLSRAPLLVWCRSFWLGRALLGTTFSWWDLPAYPLGSALGWLLLRRLERETI